MSRKATNTPNLLSFNRLKEENLKEVKKPLKNQKHQRFLEMNGNMFPNFVKVLYTKCTGPERSELGGRTSALAIGRSARLLGQVGWPCD